MGKTKGLRVEAAGGFAVEHDGRATFDMAQLVPHIQRIAEVWYYDDPDEEEEALHELLNPSASTSESAHRATLIRALDAWGFYDDSLALARETLAQTGVVSAKRDGALRPAVELAFRRAGVPSPFTKRPPKARGPYGLAVAADQWATSAAKAIIRSRTRLEGPISTVVFYLPQTAVTPWDGFVWTGKRPPSPDCSPEGDWVLEVGASHRRTKRIPSTVDEADPRLEAFCAATGVDLEETSWGPRGIPGRLWVLELRRGLSSLHQLLASSEVAIRKNARMAVFDDEGELFGRIGERDYARERKRALADAGDAHEAYERLCYER